MYQLKYDFKSKDILKGLDNVWNGKSDIPKYIWKFIETKSYNTYLYDYFDKKYCSICFSELYNDYCEKCNKFYKIESKGFYIYTDFLISDNHYYVFDIIDKNVILYDINETMSLNEKEKIIEREYNIEATFLINKNGMKNIMPNPKAFYQDGINRNSILFKDIDLSNPNNLYGYNNYGNTYVYLDNLEELKDTIYQYSYIWTAKKYLSSHKINLYQLTYYPLCIPQFEYLIKLQLYTLAFDRPDLIKYDKNFNAVKKDLPLMAKNDINRETFDLILLCGSYDKEVIDFFSPLPLNIDLVKEKFEKYNIDLRKLMKCFKTNNMDEYSIKTYIDYLDFVEILDKDISSSILYPKRFWEKHNNYMMQIDIGGLLDDNDGVNEDISFVSKMLDLNSYEDEKYVIFPAHSVEEIIEEGKQQHNCVPMYTEWYSENQTHIYFMRKKDNIKKSFVTIEVNNNKIVQASTKFNRTPSKEVKEVLEKWERSLLSINNNPY